MGDWDPQLYLRFSRERMQACRDLAARVAAMIPAGLVRNVVDLGCGPGNSTEVLARLWPDAALTGLDSSPAMIAAARQAYAELAFENAEIAAWCERSGHGFDLVFSNAALQWVPDHGHLFPRLLARVAPGGLLAVQLPAQGIAVASLLPRVLAASPQWRSHFPDLQRIAWESHDLSFYYDLLAPRAAGMEMWETEYTQILEHPDHIVEWYRGTGLRPFLAALPDDAARDRFLDEYRLGVRAAYTPRADGRVLFAFRRRFLIAEAKEP